MKLTSNPFSVKGKAGLHSSSAPLSKHNLVRKEENSENREISEKQWIHFLIKGSVLSTARMHVNVSANTGGAFPPLVDGVRQAMNEENVVLNLQIRRDRQNM